jgi:acyl-CoA synthetase (AMP-forming)/AMP-acid ligase II
MLVRDLYKKQVSKAPDAIAVVCKGKETSWRELDSLSNRFARAIAGLGIEKGDRVCALLKNSLEFIVAYLAMLKSGGVFVPLNYQLNANSIKYALNHSESKVLLCDPDLIPTIKEISPQLKTVRHLISAGNEDSYGGIVSYEQFLSRGKDVEPSTSLSEDDLAIFLYTAGTTGDPKGVVHTHFNCGYVSQHWAGVFHMAAGKSALLVLPLFHAFALHCLALPALISGTRLIVAEKYQTQWALEALQKYRANILPLAPAMGTLIIHHPDFSRYDLSGLEILLMGGAIVPFELIKQWRTTFPRLEIVNAYGQTESCPCSTGLWNVDILEKPRSVGKPWKGVDLKILNDEGKKLPSSQVGEIVYKVPSVMKEYYKDPELTAQTVKNGWLYSGDLGYMDRDGYVYIVDRKKDIIIRGGENISSMEVEEVIDTHPAVLESSVIGAPHKILGESVMAVVVKKPGQDLTEEELIQYCEKDLEHFKVPTRVVFINELPHNPGGKVLKRKLKERFFGSG